MQIQFLASQNENYYSFQQQLVELLTSVPSQVLSPIDNLYEKLLKLAHIIRVWLLLPQQAIIFYEIALNLGAEIQSKKYQAQAYFFIALAFKGMKAFKEAIMSYNRALELCPYYSDCYFNLGNIYYENTEEDQPGDYLEKAHFCHL